MQSGEKDDESGFTIEQRKDKLQIKNKAQIPGPDYPLSRWATKRRRVGDMTCINALPWGASRAA